MIGKIILIGMIVLTNQQACTTAQQWTISTSPTSVYPTSPILAYLVNPLTLQNIGFLQDTKAYTIEDVEAKAIPESKYFITKSPSSITVIIPIQYYITFSVQDTNNAPICTGSGWIASQNYTVTLAQGTQPIQWTVQSVAFTEANLVQDILISAQTPLYSLIQNALNNGGGNLPLSISQQIQTLVTSQDQQKAINTDIQTYITNQYGGAYTYSYQNTNQDLQEVQYTVTVLTSTVDGNNLVLSRLVSIDNYNANLCQQTMPQPTLTQEGAAVLQLTAYSLPQIQTTFNYALQNKYFDTELNQNWNSRIFQFNAASLQNILSGISGNYLPNILATGQCTASSNPTDSSINVLNSNTNIFQEGTNNLKVIIAYTCTLYNLGTETQETMATLTFTLNLDVSVGTEVDLLTFSGQAYTLTNLVIVGSENYKLVNTPLANLYLNSVIKDKFINQKLFGSGISTLARNTHIGVAFQNSDLIIYQTSTKLENDDERVIII